jgi:hypothetical protein
MFETVLLAENTLVTAKGDGAAVEIGDAGGRIFLLTLTISGIIEQESLELSIFGSADGVEWGAKPLFSYPQKFYRGEYPFLLDMTAHAAMKFVRAHWDVARWGRGEETPRFEFGIMLKEIPADMMSGVAATGEVTA